MAKESLYKDVSTLALKRGEKTFPFMAFDEACDWDAIYEEWVKIVKYCKRHRLGWVHDE